MLFFKRLLLSLLTIINGSLYAQNIGVKTVSPQAVLDVNGSVAFREGSPLSTVNGTNNNVVIDSMSFYRITAPTATFTITGFTNGSDGRILALINATSRTFTLSDGLQDGQILVILLTSNAAELKDTGNCNLTATYYWVPVIQLPLCGMVRPGMKPHGQTIKVFLPPSV